MGPADGEVPARHPPPEVSRFPVTADLAPPVSDEHLFRVVDALDGVARETGRTIPQVAINWLLGRPSVSTVIIGARNGEQLLQNAGLRRLDAGRGARKAARRRERRDAGLPVLAPALLLFRAQSPARVTGPGPYLETAASAARYCGSTSSRTTSSRRGCG
jgi:hypothetical protein